MLNAVMLYAVQDRAVHSYDSCARLTVEMTDSMPASLAIAGAETKSGTRLSPLRFFTSPVRTCVGG